MFYNLIEVRARDFDDDQSLHAIGICVLSRVGSRHLLCLRFARARESNSFQTVRNVYTIIYDWKIGQVVKFAYNARSSAD